MDRIKCQKEIYLQRNGLLLTYTLPHRIAFYIFLIRRDKLILVLGNWELGTYTIRWTKDLVLSAASNLSRTQWASGRPSRSTNPRLKLPEAGTSGKPFRQNFYVLMQCNFCIDKRDFVFWFQFIFGVNLLWSQSFLVFLFKTKNEFHALCLVLLWHSSWGWAVQITICYCTLTHTRTRTHTHEHTHTRTRTHLHAHQSFYFRCQRHRSWLPTMHRFLAEIFSKQTGRENGRTLEKWMRWMHLKRNVCVCVRTWLSELRESKSYRWSTSVSVWKRERKRKRERERERERGAREEVGIARVKWLPAKPIFSNPPLLSS